MQLEMPSQDELVELLTTSNLQSAEVVELADTPSMLVVLLLLYKHLLVSILPFTSITSTEQQNSGQEAPVGAGYRKSVQNPVQ